VLNIQKGVVYVKQEKPQKTVRKNKRIENSFPCPVQAGKHPPSLVCQRHIQRDPEPDRSFRTRIDAAIAVPAGFRIRYGRETAFGGAEVDIFTADVYALVALLT
jgi:hypothetical protein